jgi:glyoxylase-like metal-dependent hydrolase (beta-lactamase superfamily II)/rhodanese-related sulfurtransferase
MILRQFYLGCLAHASYSIADTSQGVAAVVDPQRDIEIYLEAAQSLGVAITHVFLTHFHADFIAGHLELRERTGAEICLGSRARASYPFHAFEDGEELALGGVKLRVLHTPGHTPESITLLVFEPGAPVPHAALTGDTLFAGDVGRPDLRAALGWSALDLGRLLYQSIQEKILPLPDATLVYPAHGAGSLCGKNISTERVTTIGAQRQFNYALQPMSEDQFLKIVLADQPEAPAYFTYDAVLNSQEHPSLATALEQSLRALSATELRQLQGQGIMVLDTRPASEFAAAHWPGAINIPLDGAFATWCGTVLQNDAGGRRSLAIIANPGRERESALRLGRIGWDAISGYLKGGMASALDVVSHPRIPAALVPSDAWLLDVRTDNERAHGALAGSTQIPLAQLSARRAELPSGRPIVAYCQSGYRSSIAVSLLQSWGLDATDIEGGYASLSVMPAPVPSPPAPPPPR